MEVPNPMDAITHFRCNVMGDPQENGRLLAAFQSLQVQSMLDFIILEQEDLESATTIDNGKLTRIEIRKLLKAKEWFMTQSGTKDMSTWFELTSESFSTYLISGHAKDTIPPATTTPPPMPTVVSPPKPSAAQEFSKGIKRDVTQYKEFTDDSKWVVWHRHLKSLAATHGIENILSSTYVPSSDTDKELFQQQQNFAYSIFERCLKTAKSMKFVREFETDRDAQALYCKLLEAYQQGVQAELLQEKIQEEIQNLRLTSSWSRTLEYFLVTFEHKLLDLELITNTPISDTDKRKWLISSIRGHEQLYSAATMSMIVQQTTGNSTKVMSYDDFFSMILSTAQVLDQNAKDNAQRKRKANKTAKTHTSTKRDSKKSTSTDNGRILPKDVWAKMSREERSQHIEKFRNKAKSSSPKGNKAHGTRAANESKTTNNNDSATLPTSPDDASATGSSDVPPGSMLRSLLSANQASRGGATKETRLAPGTNIVLNGQTFKACMSKCTYHISKHVQSSRGGSLIDGGCNGGLAGDDVVVLEETTQLVDITGIADSKIESVPISTVAGLISSTEGPIIGIFHQYAAYGKGSTIHSVNQLRSFGLDVNDIPTSCPGGKQCISTPDGHKIPLAVRDGLCYMDMRAPTDDELTQLPHVLMTSDDPWDPHSLDSEPDDLHFFNAEMAEDIEEDWVECSDDYGEVFNEHELNVTACLRAVHTAVRSVFTGAVKPPRSILPKKPNYDALRPYFGWTTAERVKATLENTTQWFRASGRLPMRRHYKTRFPAANVSRWNEDVATDTFFSDVPAHDDGIPGHGGCTMAQIYTGITSHFTKVYPMSSESQIPDTLRDLLRDRGAPNNIKSDCAKSQQSHAFKDILRHYRIGQYFSEPYQQNQNPAERRIQDVKKDVNTIMDRTGTPPEFWLLCTLFVVYLSNVLAAESLGFITPTQIACGYVPDVSSLLHFHWWQPVYYAEHEGTFAKSKEKLGRWVGVAENVGDVLTWWILTDDTKQVIPRSMVRSALDVHNLNLRAMSPADDPLDIMKDNSLSLDGEVTGESTSQQPKFNVLSTADLIAPGFDPAELKLPRFSIEELMGRTFLVDMEDGQRLRAEIVQKINDQDAQNHKNIKLLCKVGDEGAEEILTYQEICDLVEQQDAEELGEDKLWTFKKILDHNGPLKPSDKEWKGSQFNVRVLWEDNTITDEPLKLIAKDDPVSAATYAYQNDLLETPGWKHLRHIVKNQKKFGRMAKQAALKSIRRAPIYMFGVQVPRTSHEARLLDAKNGNTKWQDAEKCELDQLNEYGTFEDKGKGAKPPDGHQRINVHFVYAVKHDLRHKARLVAGGHMTEPPKDSVYSGVVSLRSMRLALLVGEINGLKTMVGDIGNAYLEAYTKEKVYFIAGKEFGPLEGHLLKIVKALYGLRTSGARFHEKLADTLRNMGFTPSLADPDLWIREAGDCYEYICVYVDDLMAIMKDPQKFFDTLKEKYNYILKGVGPPEYHLGGNFGRDPDGTLFWGAQSYVEKMLNNYERLFGSQPKKYSAPLDKDDSPELDQTDLLNEGQRTVYQSLIGALQWCVTLGRFDIAVSVMTMSSFRAAPREGHLERLKRIYGYLRKHPEGAIRFRTGIPPCEEMYSMPDYEWMHTVYGDCQEDVSPDLPVPKGKMVRMTSMVDANLMHCKVTGKSATGILHLINQTPVDWFSRKQSTVETATYGSEFVAARIATEQVIDLRYTLRSMGVPIENSTWLLGDNKSVITSSTIPHSSLSKRHQALAYHRVRSAVAAGFLKFCHIDGKQNPADIMTKFLPYPVFWPFVQPLLFWKGETQVTPARL